MSAAIQWAAELWDEALILLVGMIAGYVVCWRDHVHVRARCSTELYRGLGDKRSEAPSPVRERENA